MNEILLVASLFVIYGCVLLAYRLFGKSGLYCFTAIATITANIEVSWIMVKSLRHGADAGKYPVCIHLPGNGYHQ